METGLILLYGSVGLCLLGGAVLIGAAVARWWSMKEFPAAFVVGSIIFAGIGAFLIVVPQAAEATIKWSGFETTFKKLQVQISDQRKELEEKDTELAAARQRTAELELQLEAFVRGPNPPRTPNQQDPL